MRKRTWTVNQLKRAVANSTSIRQVLAKLGLREAGGNYAQIKKYLKECSLDARHFTGSAWNRGLHLPFAPKIPLEEILTKDSAFQSYKLKRRLLLAGLKYQCCEECGWAQRTLDNRIPLELDHINGDSRDNRLENLRILCPNCHSLKLTHRGRNRKKRIAHL